MWLLLGLAFADSADSGDTDPYRDSGFTTTTTYTQTSNGCGGSKAAALLLAAAFLTRSGRAGAGRGGWPPSRRALPPTG